MAYWQVWQELRLGDMNYYNNLGCRPLTHVYTAGGGAANSTWTVIRQRYLKVPIVSSVNTEAAYGTALLAMGEIKPEPTTEVTEE